MGKIALVAFIIAACVWLVIRARRQQRRWPPTHDVQGRKICHHSYGLAGGFSRCSGCGPNAVAGKVRR